MSAVRSPEGRESLVVLVGCACKDPPLVVNYKTREPPVTVCIRCGNELHRRYTSSAPQIFVSAERAVEIKRGHIRY